VQVTSHSLRQTPGLRALRPIQPKLHIGQQAGHVPPSPNRIGRRSINPENRRQWPVSEGNFQNPGVRTRTLAPSFPPQRLSPRNIKYLDNAPAPLANRAPTSNPPCGVFPAPPFVALVVVMDFHDLLLPGFGGQRRPRPSLKLCSFFLAALSPSFGAVSTLPPALAWCDLTIAWAWDLERFLSSKCPAEELSQRQIVRQLQWTRAFDKAFLTIYFRHARSRTACPVPFLLLGIRPPGPIKEFAVPLTVV